MVVLNVIRMALSIAREAANQFMGGSFYDVLFNMPSFDYKQTDK
jgi:hypothetical protein